MVDRDKEKQRLADIVEELRIRVAQKDILEFTKATKPDYQVAKFHRLAADKLNDFAFGKIKRLILQAPPRHGKSELSSRRLPAFIFGNFPTAKIIACSYSADLSSRMNRDVQRIIDSPEYARVFPGTKLFGTNVRTAAQGTWIRNADIFEIVGHGGVYRSAGIGGGITGMGSNFSILDDVIKDAAQASSKVYRDAAWDWYTSTLYSRLEAGGSILLTLTRWHQDDLAGRIIENAKQADSEPWEVVAYQGIKESHPYEDANDTRGFGEALWPEKYPSDKLAQMKATVGSRFFSALWQQNPTIEQGNIVRREWIKFYKALPETFDEIGISWDLANKGGEDNDYSVGQVWGRLGAQRYLIDQVRRKMNFSEEVSSVRSLKAKHPRTGFVLIEQKANGFAVIEHLKKEIPGIVPFNPKTSKEERLIAVSPQYEAGNIFYPDPSIAPWVHDNIEELVGFPNEKNDDSVDCSVQLLLYFQSRSVGTFKAEYNRPAPTIGSGLRGKDTW